MKIDDRVWVDAWIKGQVIPDALQNAWIPDHPALPAVARWLADDPRNSEMLRVIVAAEAKDAEKWGMDRAAGAWRSLIAALTEGRE